MNAPERIHGLMVAPGVVSLQNRADVDIGARKRAVKAILRQIKRTKPSQSKNAQHYLARVRARHDR